MNKQTKEKKKAIIFGAGPAGLTAAYELFQKSDVKPIIYEMSDDTGGISKTVNYKGNRIDIGGHRFFSKSKIVMDWWLKILPIQNENNGNTSSKFMLIRQRLSRIFYLRKFFNYPISLNLNTLKNLGVIRIIKIGYSYLLIKIFPLKNEKSLEDFFINRFGKELYITFFKDYTEKVWGIPCENIKAEWGAQRIKGLSVSKTISHAIKNIFFKNRSIDQKNTETSLIEQYLYPKFGPGQLWEEVANQILEKGGEIHKNQKIVGVNLIENKIKNIIVENQLSGEKQEINGDYFISSMPVKDLVSSIKNPIPEDVRKVSNGLIYRDFITVGLLLKKMKIKNNTKIQTKNNLIPDTWIYIQERDVKIGRLQVFNNWSPFMVKNPEQVWIGLEYFCNEGDELWSKPDKDFLNFAIYEMCKIDMIEKKDVLDGIVIRMPKTYPAYFGSYDNFDTISNFTDTIENLFLVGRNGMHRYNNMDHSMLTAMTAVENIINNIKTKNNIWSVNTEKEYHESK
ncbi:MAG: NAD(P)/FAD-dependent oxidoreductase [Bacteroidales bacterium]|nr:NAD(P)/FAD-dependent oxidoreductase [Bacteroidales bacterium]